MAIIKKYNKSNNTTYVYDSVSYWDKEKQQPRSKRKLIGKIDPETGEVVPTSGRGRKPKEDPGDIRKASSVPPSPSVGVTSDETAAIQPEGDELMARLEDCRRQLLEKEAALAKAESTVARLSAERQDIAGQLEQMLRILRH